LFSRNQLEHLHSPAGYQADSLIELCAEPERPLEIEFLHHDGEALRIRLEGLPKAVRDIAWKAQVRLCARYRRLSASGKKPPVVVAAIAREMAAFLWAIGREVAPS
jgi:hypothetical protein